jgi:hypothetical protein
MWEIQFKMASIQIIPMAVAQKKMCSKFAKSSTKTGKIAFWRSLTGYTSHMEHASEVLGKTEVYISALTKPGDFIYTFMRAA